MGYFTVIFDHDKYNIISPPRDDYRIVYHKGVMKIAYGKAWFKGHRTTLYVEDYEKLSYKTAELSENVDHIGNELATMFCPDSNTTELNRELATLEKELAELE